MRSSCSGVHLSSTGSRSSNGTPPVSYSTEKRALHLNMKSNKGTKFSTLGWTLLTVNVVLQRADALLIQAHHGWEETGFGTRVHLHLAVQSLTSENHGLFVTEISLPHSFKTNDMSRAKLYVYKKERIGLYLFTCSTFFFKAVVYTGRLFQFRQSSR